MKSKKGLCVSAALLAAFVAWTVLVRFVDVQAIGPGGTSVGFATLNRYFHSLTGVNMWLYTVTDWLGLVPIAIVLGFAVLGLAQWIRRKRILSVDRSILVLGAFYASVMAVYVLFEFVVVNFRPVLIEGVLEASYPSSTTMLVLCVMSTAIMQAWERIKNKIVLWIVISLTAAFIVFMLIGRVLAGVHWITDILGGMLISASLVSAYAWLVKFLK